MEPHARELHHFIERRRVLNEELAATGAEIDRWIGNQSLENVDMHALATLEGLLVIRQAALAGLISLDEDFMDYLISLRTARKD